MIQQTDYSTILNIWNNFLWTDRKSKIESHSAMLIDRTYSLKNFEYEPKYFIYLINNQIVGCNSGHGCADGTYRSRGLYVFNEYRGQGIGKELLEHTIHQGSKENSKFVWSYPRQTSWKTYSNAGFELASEWEEGEMGYNAYCIKAL